MNAYYSQETHGPFELVSIGELALEEGGAIPDCRLAVATHGSLNAARDNAILVPTWYSGTSKIMEQVYIGAGRHRAMGFDSLPAFVDNFMTGYFAPMDPNNLLAMAWKWQHGDVSRNTNGDLAAALGRVKAKTFVMPISTDMFFRVNDCEVEQKLIPGSELRPLASIDGHLGLFGTDPQMLAQLDANLRELLATPVG